ncbi:hypothetical protein [Microbacterium lacus]|uniref:hypothetical protein n=1 Tax=Microbacterium lacus TaxID=415217 RepID=UPI0031D6FAA5
MRFTEFLSPDDPMLLAWARFRGALAMGPTRVPAPLRPARAADPVSGLWRLLATNNRELGRSFLLYRRIESAQAHVTQLQSDPDALTIEHVPGPTSGSRGWVVLASGSPVMTCSRWYGSLSTGAVAAAGALAALRTAVITDVPDRSDSSGRFRRRTALDANAAP